LVVTPAIALLPLLAPGARASGVPATLGAGTAYALTGVTTKLLSDGLDTGAWLAAAFWLATTALGGERGLHEGERRQGQRAGVEGEADHHHEPAEDPAAAAQEAPHHVEPEAGRGRQGARLAGLQQQPGAEERRGRHGRQGAQHFRHPASHHSLPAIAAREPSAQAGEWDDPSRGIAGEMAAPPPPAEAAPRGLLWEQRRFLRSFLTSPRGVGAVLPTSARTVAAMLDLAPVERARTVVELGAQGGEDVATRLPQRAPGHPRAPGRHA
jgi:hypothetical protein